MASYNRIRAAKQSPIGTIMPWAGSSSSSSLAEDAVPFGYIVCRGQTLLARDYPLLAQLIGNAGLILRDIFHQEECLFLLI